MTIRRPVNNPLDEQAYPLAIGGEPFIPAPVVTEEEKQQMKDEAAAKKAEEGKK